MLDPNSNEDLWLIKEQENISFECQYDNVDPLKDVIYSFIVEYIPLQTSDNNIGRNPLNDIDWDLIQSEKASRFASCIYETKSEDIPE